MPLQLLYRPSALSLDPNGGLRRHAPRPLGLQQADYAEKFDSETVFYDAVYEDGRVRLIGPPLLNLGEALAETPVTDDFGQSHQIEQVELDRTQASFFQVQARPSRLNFSGQQIRGSIDVTPSQQGLFAGQVALVAKSQNNDLSWIRDWATFYHRVHGVTGVVLYDNNSTKYSAQDVLETLGSVDGLVSVCVVDWPFKFGPQGGDWGGVAGAPWDSDFTEYGIFEHARRMFLDSASVVINADIDELVVANGGSVIDWLDSSEGMVSYEGTWIENVLDDRPRQEGALPSFADFTTALRERRFCTSKWALAPHRARNARQWKTHSIAGFSSLKLPVEAVSHRHFVGISTGWKFDRSSANVFDPAVHWQDSALVRDFESAFGASRVARRKPAYSSPIPSIGPTAVRPPIGPLALRERLADELGAAATKVWVYQDSVVVIEVVAESNRIAFDLVPSARGIEVKAVARTEEAKSWLADRLKGSPASLLSSGKHWLLGVVNNSVSDDDQIEAILSYFGATVYAN